MIETGITEGINKFYFIFKLNLYFWLLSLLGLGIFGIGPAFLTIIQLYQEVEWDFKELSVKKAIAAFKVNFKQGNQISYTYLAITMVLFFSLWTAGQLPGLVFLMIDLLLVFLLVVTIISSLFAIVIAARYEISLVNLLKLATVLFFKEVKASFALIVILVIISLVTFKLPGLLLFASISTLAVFLSRTGEKVFATLTVTSS